MTDTSSAPSPLRRSPRTLPILAVASAIAITATMDATGLTALSALPLALLMGLFWLLQKNSRVEVGFCRGPAGAYALAFLHPIFALPALALLALVGGDLALGEFDAREALTHVAQVSVGTFLVVIITEEGFFRGWLWAALGRAGFGKWKILLHTTVAFTVWHVSFATLASGYELPPATLPAYLGNVFLLGLIWGLMRQASGSILVPSLAHGVWNGLVYVLFGLANESGLFGIEATSIYGPETGWLGLVVNGVAAAWLWRRVFAVRAGSKLAD